MKIDDLNGWRFQSDHLGDDTIAALFAEHSLDEVNRVMASLVLDDQVAPASLPTALQHYLFLSGRLPDWADPDLIRAGQEVFAERGPLILMALLTASLAECYALGKGVQTLYLTHRMDERHIYRRVYETAQFIVEVCAPGGLGPAGKGIRAIQKVRLMHASIRHLILAPVPAGHDMAATNFSAVLLGTHWDTPKLGLPINWEDQAFTLQSFGHVILQCLDRMGSPCSPDERAAWIHLWAVVGHVLGITDELIPKTPADAKNLYWAIRRDQQRPTPEGRELTKALGSFVAQKLDSPFFGRHVTTVLLRWLCDAETCAIVGVSPLDRDETWGLDAARWLVRHLWRDPDDWLHEVLGTYLVTHLTKLPRGWQRGLFAIPTELTTRWSRL